MKQQLDASGKKLSLSNVQRRSLAKKAKALGWEAKKGSSQKDDMGGVASGEESLN